MLSCSFHWEMTFDFFSSLIWTLMFEASLWLHPAAIIFCNVLMSVVFLWFYSRVLRLTSVAILIEAANAFCSTWKIIFCCKQWQTAMICSCCSCLVTLWALTPNNLKSDLFSFSTINNSVSDVYSDFLVISWRISTVHQSGAGLSGLRACDASIKLPVNTESHVQDVCVCVGGAFRPCCVEVGVPPFRVPRCLPFTWTKCAVTQRRCLRHLRHHVDRPHRHSRH